MYSKKQRNTSVILKGAINSNGGIHWTLFLMVANKFYDAVSIFTKFRYAPKWKQKETIKLDLASALFPVLVAS